MELKAWALTDVGLKRENNQDSILARPDLGLFVVADGMGGHQGGEVASRMAVQIVENLTVDKAEFHDSEIKSFLINSYKEATRQIYLKSDQETSLKGMATTMVLLLRCGAKIYIANVGDSRAYLIRPEGLWQLTEDHSLFNEQLKAGLVKESDRDHFEGKNVITRSVGFESDVECDVIDREMESDDTYLLCSDGLSGLMSDKEILKICLEKKPQEAVRELVELAKKNGGDDNISVIIVQPSEHKSLDNEVTHTSS